MPLRDYQCDVCGQQQEALVRRPDDEAELRCQACGSIELTRQISQTAPTTGSCKTGSSGFG